MWRFLLTVIPFFEGLDNELLPNIKVWIIFDLESDANLTWQAGADCRVVVTSLQLFVPRKFFLQLMETSCLRKDT